MDADKFAEKLAKLIEEARKAGVPVEELVAHLRQKLKDAEQRGDD